MYVNPHNYDYRTDPTQHTNEPAFWVGYGKYREGINYTDLPDGRDYLAGWCYGLNEGKQEQAKPIWQSKSFFDGMALIVLSIWGGLNTELIANNPTAVSMIGAVFGAITVWLRSITKGPIK